MSEKCIDPDRRFIVRGETAVSAEFHEASKSFAFLMEDGSTEAVSFAEADQEQIETFILDVRKFIPIVRIGNNSAP